MGQVKSTYSYRSKKDALEKMFDQLDYYDIPLCYSDSKRYFVFEKPKTRRYIYIHIRTDLWGNKYYECCLE